MYSFLYIILLTIDIIIKIAVKFQKYICTYNFRPTASPFFDTPFINAI